MKTLKPVKMVLFVEGEKLLFLGKHYSITQSKTKKIKIINKKIFVPEGKGIKKLIINWYKLKSKEIFCRIADKLSIKNGLHYNKIKITTASKRWGSCSKDNNICLNWKLLQTPKTVIEYVILHELIHTKIKNHKKEFWDLLKSICKDFKKSKDWLEENVNMINQI